MFGNKRLITLMNFLLFGICITYFTFLLSRILLERNPVDPIFLTGLFAGLFLFFTIGRYILAFFIIIYFLIFPAKEKPFLLAEKIEEFFKEEFFHKFLDKKPFFNRLFFKIALLVSFFIRKFPRLVLFFIIYLPWIGFLLTFFYELFCSDKLVIALYFLSFSILIKRIFYLLLYISNIKFWQANELAFEKYFPGFTSSASKREFCMRGVLISELLFTFSQLFDPRIVKYLWTGTFEAVSTYHQKLTMDCFKDSFFPKADNFIKKTNLLIFSFVFFVLLNKDFIQNFYFIDLFFLVLTISFYFFSSMFLSQTKSPYEKAYNWIVVGGNHLKTETRRFVIEFFKVTLQDLPIDFPLKSGEKCSIEYLTSKKLLPGFMDSFVISDLKPEQKELIHRAVNYLEAEFLKGTPRPPWWTYRKVGL